MSSGGEADLERRNDIAQTNHLSKKRKMDDGISEEVSGDVQNKTVHEAAGHLQGLAAFLVEVQRRGDQSKQEIADLLERAMERNEDHKKISGMNVAQQEQIDTLEDKIQHQKDDLEALRGDLRLTKHMAHRHLEERERLSKMVQTSGHECTKTKAELEKKSQECADAQAKLKDMSRNGERRQAVVEAAVELVEGYDSLSKKMTKLEQTVKDFRGS